MPQISLGLLGCWFCPGSRTGGSVRGMLVFLRIQVLHTAFVRSSVVRHQYHYEFISAQQMALGFQNCTPQLLLGFQWSTTNVIELVGMFLTFSDSDSNVCILFSVCIFWRVFPGFSIWDSNFCTSPNWFCPGSRTGGSVRGMLVFLRIQVFHTAFDRSSVVRQKFH